jgi:hypothetical protein
MVAAAVNPLQRVAAVAALVGVFAIAPATAQLRLVETRLRPAPAGGGDRLATSIVATPEGLLLGAPRDSFAGPDAGAVYVVRAIVSPTGPSFDLAPAVLFDIDPAPDDAFGTALASMGTGALVGAPGDDGAGPDAGTVIVFPDLSGGGAERLVAPGLVPGAAFGWAVAVADGDAIVGAPGPTGEGNSVEGRVFVFRGADDTNPLVLGDPTAAPGTGFGFALAALGNVLAIGAPESGDRRGRVFLYDRASDRLVRTFESPDPAVPGRFGAAVAVAPARLVIGAPSGPSGGAVYVFDLDTGGLLRSFTAPVPAAGDGFGTGLALAANRLLIGAPHADGGAAFAFDLQAGTRSTSFPGSGVTVGDGFGASVAFLGEEVVVGAPHDDAGSIDGGAAYVFAGDNLAALLRKRALRSQFGGAMTSTDDGRLAVGASAENDDAGAVYYDGAPGPSEPEAQVPVTGSALKGRFGYQLAASDGRLVIGAPGAPGEGPGTVFVLDGGEVPASLDHPDAQPGDQFGFAVAGTADAIGVGAPLAGDLDSGRVYVYGAPGFGLQMKFQAPTPGTGDFFGAALAIDTEGLVVGAPFDGGSAPFAGAAYLFGRATATVEHVFQGPRAEELFGSTVAMSSATIAVGAPRGGDVAGVGRVFLFDRRNGGLRHVIENPSPDADDWFGVAIAMDDRYVYVGAPFDDVGGSDAGTAYVFDVASATLVTTLPNPAGVALDRFGFAFTLLGTRVAIGAPGASRVYVYETAPAVRPLGPAGGCGDGIVTAPEVCDDGNLDDTDDCRNDCTRIACCVLVPAASEHCPDDGDPCTTIVSDPVRGCLAIDNGTCCRRDEECPGGSHCRLCVGCFIFPWACCAQGSSCVPVHGGCTGARCFAKAACLCEGELVCDDGSVPLPTRAHFDTACEAVRVVANEPAVLDLRTAREQSRTALRSVQRAMRLARVAARGDKTSRACKRAMIKRLTAFKRAVPVGEKILRCLAPTSGQ